ncbi:restriction endonuclease [Glycomyces sp. MUSA5-2]|uniref:restriction endonuclease n=1 Tax=Glycomyces sp. MUSA5-2 TaxID=2053002 RepID=UPI00300B28D5
MQHSTDWELAEEFALDHMRHLGFKDAKMNSGGADGGIDIESAAAAAQVKHLQSKVSRPDVQRFHGAAPANKFRLFYSLAGYSREARLWADEHNIALFTFDLETRVAKPVTSVAIQLDKGLSDPRPPQTMPHVHRPPEQTAPYTAGPYSSAPYGRMPPPVQPSPPASLADAIRASKEPQPFRWYFAVALFTASTFAWIPFLHAYSATNNPRWRNWGIGFIAWCILLLSLSTAASAASDESQGLSTAQYLVSFAAVGGIAVAFLRLTSAREEVLNPAPAQQVPPPPSYFDPPSPTESKPAVSSPQQGVSPAAFAATTGNFAPPSPAESKSAVPSPQQGVSATAFAATTGNFAPPPPRPDHPRWYKPSPGRIIGSIAWCLSPALTLGFGTPITFTIAAVRRRSLEMIAYAAAYLGLSVWMYAAGGPEATGTLAFEFWLMFSWVLANIHTFLIRRRVWYLPYQPDRHEPDPLPH